MFGNGFGYLLSEGNFEHQDSPLGGGSSHHQTLEPRGLGEMGGGAVGAYYSQHWERGAGRGFTALLKFATFFLQDPRKHSFPQHHGHRELAHWGPAPAWRHGSGLMHFGSWGAATRLSPPGFPQPQGPCGAHSEREMAPLEIQLICTGQALVTQKQRFD